jgi:hypothetical protein
MESVNGRRRGQQRRDTPGQLHNPAAQTPEKHCESSAHGAPEICRQWPAPSHACPGLSQLNGACRPRNTCAQVPLAAPVYRFRVDWHTPPHAELLQTPDTQNKVWHWTGEVHAAPLGAGSTQSPVDLSQLKLGQSALLVHCTAATQLPFAQACPDPQARPHAPQLFGSEVWFTFRQAAPQEVSPGAQRHWPPEQLCESPQALPHTPQFEKS